MKTKIISPQSKKMEQIGGEMFTSLYEALISDGHINPDGKTEEQIIAEVSEAALKWSKQRPMMWALDFRQILLNRARSCKRKRDDHEAILYYATWFEHWINGILVRKLRVLDRREVNQMIRDVSLRGKYTWLLPLLHEKRIPQRHIKSILQVCELRNEFVHYKYKMVDVDSNDENKKLKEAHHSAEQSIRYLQKFEQKHFFKGAANGLFKKLKSTKQVKAK